MFRANIYFPNSNEKKTNDGREKFMLYKKYYSWGTKAIGEEVKE